MCNITTVFGITHRGHSCKWMIYEWLIIIDPRIGTKLGSGGGDIVGYSWEGVYVIGLV